MTARPLPSTYPEWLARAQEQADRFWSKVDKSPHPKGCWLWTAGKDKDGYGKFQITGRGPRFEGDNPVQKHVRAHKLAWELVHGAVPDGLVLLHSCDTMACCNPQHLSPGTQGQNRADCVAKERGARGETHGSATITEETVRAVRELRARGATLSAIAATFGITKSHASLICTRRTWRHVA